MGVVILIVVVASTVWVGIDASGRDFSMARGAGPRTTPGWVAGSALQWIVFFPWYLAVRSRGLPHAQAVGESTPSAPMPPLPSGWYSDPSGGSRLRWWDGSRWSQHTAD
jgi:hypothetical protein